MFDMNKKSWLMVAVAAGLVVISKSAYSVQSSPDNDVMSKLNTVSIPFVMNSSQASELVISCARTFADDRKITTDFYLNIYIKL
jgi:hypothetical protein